MFRLHPLSPLFPYTTLFRSGNIFEGSRSRPFPMPALHGTGFTEMMAAAANSLGWHPFPGPAAINSRTYDGRSRSEEHTSELQSQFHLVCRLLLEKKKKRK